MMRASKEQVLANMINKAKGDVCKEFEKVCPTDVSFSRVKKDMHDIFESLQQDIAELIRKK